jgi:hypothetical protein
MTMKSESERVGVAEADAADLALRLKESQAREKRLIQRAVAAEERLGEALRDEHELRDQIDRLVRFNRAVERSVAWKGLQAARSLLGRKW